MLGQIFAVVGVVGARARQRERADDGQCRGDGQRAARAAMLPRLEGELLLKVRAAHRSVREAARAQLIIHPLSAMERAARHGS